MGADEADIPKGTEKSAAQTGGKRRPKPPVTIDLTAESVPSEPLREPEAAMQPAEPDPAAAPDGPADPPGPETPESESAKSEPPPGPAEPPATQKGSGDLGRLVAAAAIGGLVVLGLGFGLQAAGVIPTPGRDIALQAQATGSNLARELSGLDQRLTSIESTSAQTMADRALLDDLARRVGVADAFGSSLGDRLLALEASVAELDDKTNAGATQPGLDALESRLSALEGRATPSGGAAAVPGLAALEQRVAALEAQSAPPSAAPEPAVRPAPAPAPVPARDDVERADAVAALRAASAAGNFGSELAVIGALGIGAPEVAELAPFADKNVPSRAALAQVFPEVANAILVADARADGGITGELLAYGRRLVRVRPAGPIAGTHPEAIVSRIEAALKSGDLDAARTEWETLPAAGKQASQAWADQLADRVAIDRLVGQLAASLGTSAGNG